MPGKKSKKSKLDQLDGLNFDETRFDVEIEDEIAEVMAEMEEAGVGPKAYHIPGTEPRLVAHKFLASQWSIDEMCAALEKLDVENLTRSRKLKKYKPHIGEWYLVQFTEELEPDNVKSRTKKLDTLAFKNESIYYGFDLMK